MKLVKRALLLVVTFSILASSAGAAGLFSAFQDRDAYTVTEEEYALLEKYKRLEELISIIDKTFLWEYDEQALMEGAAQGLLGALGDDYTFYYSPDKMEKESEQLSGEYGGLGIEVFANAKDNTITIKRVFYGSPAQMAGIRPTDKIIRVNDEEVGAAELFDAVEVMRGEIGEEVSVTILRDQEVFDVTMKRDLVQTQIISYEMLEDGIGYVRIYYFEGNLMGQFDEAVQSLKADGIEGLIVDLRENPGGLVDLAISFVDYFVDDERILMTEDKFGRQRSFFGEDGSWEIPVVILQDKYSASASEIVAVSLQEIGRAKVVGEQSFGKGIMQSVYPFYTDGAGMQITTDYWLSPSGENLHEVGVTPDVEVERAEDAVDDNYQFVREKDNQLHEGVVVLQEMMESQEVPAA